MSLSIQMKHSVEANCLASVHDLGTEVRLQLVGFDSNFEVLLVFDLELDIEVTLPSSIFLPDFHNRLCFG